MPFFRWLAASFSVKGQTSPLIYVVESFRPAITSEYKLAQANRAYKPACQKKAAYDKVSGLLMSIISCCYRPYEPASSCGLRQKVRACAYGRT